MYTRPFAPVRNSRTGAHNEFKGVPVTRARGPSSKHEAHSLEVAVVAGGPWAVARIGGFGDVSPARRLARNRSPRQPQDRLCHPGLFHGRQGLGPVLHGKPIGRPVRKLAAPFGRRAHQHRRRAFLRPRRHRFHWFGPRHCLHGQARRGIDGHPTARQAPVHRPIRDDQFL